MKKWLGMLLSALLLIGVMAACAPDRESSSGSGEVNLAAEMIRVLLNRKS